MGQPFVTQVKPCQNQEVAKEVSPVHYAPPAKIHVICTECSVCNMPLCTKIHDGFEMSCLDAWHTVDDLEGEQKKRQGALTAHRNELKASKKGKLV